MCIKGPAGWLAVSRPGAKRKMRSQRGLPCQPGKWNFIWMNRLTAQKERGRIGSGITTSTINGKKLPDRINGEKSGMVPFAFVLGVMK